MLFALVARDEVVETRTADTDRDQRTLRDAGWVEVVEYPQPTATATEVFDTYTVEVVGGMVKQRWQPREASEVEASRAGRMERFAAQLATVRLWARDAQTVTVTAANAVAVLGTTVTRFGAVLDGLADLIEQELNRPTTDPADPEEDP